MAVVARFFILLVFLISIAQSGIIRLDSSDDHLISDGVEKQESSSFKTSVTSSPSVPAGCHHQYGFLPCAENTAGYIYSILVYLGILIFGEKQIGSGSKVLFNVIGAGEFGVKFGGIIFRILLSLPSMMLMIASGIFSSKENAQSLVSVGVGIYAGIAVFSLTVQWGRCVMSGTLKKWKQISDKPDGNSDSESCLPAKEKLSILKDIGVDIDDWTRTTVRIMLLSLIPYVVVQLVDVFNTSSVKRIITLIALVVSSLSLLSYFIYQIADPWMQQRSLEYCKYEIDYWRHEILRTALNHVQGQGQLVNEDGKLNTQLIEKIFTEIDTDGDNLITENELEDLELKMIENGKLNVDGYHAVKELMKTYTDKSNNIKKEEFFEGFQKLVDDVQQLKDFTEKKKGDPPAIGEYGKRDIIKSAFQVLLGIVILTSLSGPLMNDILQLSYSMRLPSFSISFVMVPLAMNARRPLAALFTTSQKGEKLAASLTFSEIYGGVIMNNISGMTALLAIVYARDLTWDFSAEVLTILVVCLIVGILAYKCETYRLWTCILAFVLYPFSLGLLYFVQVFLSWN